MINSNDLRDPNRQKLGGCIRTFNILYRNITGLIVDSVYSDLTTVGIILIDHFSDLDINFKVILYMYKF